MAGEVRINGTRLEPQPSRFEAIPPKPSRMVMVNGGQQSSYHLKGWMFRITYGTKFASPLALANLRTRLGTVGTTASLSYVDHAGITQTKTIQVDQEPEVMIGLGGLAEQFSIELVEAP